MIIVIIIIIMIILIIIMIMMIAGQENKGILMDSDGMRRHSKWTRTWLEAPLGRGGFICSCVTGGRGVRPQPWILCVFFVHFSLFSVLLSIFLYSFSIFTSLGSPPFASASPSVRPPSVRPCPGSLCFSFSGRPQNTNFQTPNFRAGP